MSAKKMVCGCVMFLPALAYFFLSGPPYLLLNQVFSLSSPFSHVSLLFQSMGGPHSKTINMGGVQKEVVSNQFNCPLNMYSDEAIAEAAMTNKQHNIG